MNSGSSIGGYDVCRVSWKLGDLIFGAEDFRSGISPQASLQAILFARSLIVPAARVSQLQAIAMTLLDLNNVNVVIREAIESREFGLTGRQLIHFMQIECVTKALRPGGAEVKRLTKWVEDFARNFDLQGKGVIETDGSMPEKA
jgi:citrate lyase beta subunit